MPGKTAFSEELNLDWQFGLGDFVGGGKPDHLGVTDYDVALFKGDPEGGGVEVSGGSYAREAIPVGPTGFARTDSTVTIVADCDFGTASADWAALPDQLKFWAVFAGSDMIYSNPLVVSRPVLTGDEVKFPAGTLTWTED